MSTKIHPVDAHVGARIRQRRTLIGVSQSKLAEGADITFQQVQKYENGSNRCSASMLWRFAKTLEVEPGYFFEDYRGNTAGRVTPNPLAERDVLEMAKAYTAIPNKRARRALRQLANSMAVPAVSA